ncbi:unnamed protein product [Penicillium bialowiezense]
MAASVMLTLVLAMGTAMGLVTKGTTLVSTRERAMTLAMPMMPPAQDVGAVSHVAEYGIVMCVLSKTNLRAYNHASFPPNSFLMQLSLLRHWSVCFRPGVLAFESRPCETALPETSAPAPPNLLFFSSLSLKDVKIQADDYLTSIGDDPARRDAVIDGINHSDNVDFLQPHNESSPE